MKAINTTLILSILMLNLISINISSAQESYQEKAKEMTDKLKEELTLSEDQYDSVLVINEKYIQKFEELRGEEQGRPDPNKREEFMKTKQEWDYELKQVLSEDQFKKYQEFKQKNRRKMMRR